MNNTDIINFYQQDIQKVIDELNAFADETNIWKTHGSIKNSAGNLVLHLVGGLNYLIGTNLANTGYVRNRDAEFTVNGISRAELVAQLVKLDIMVGKTIGLITADELDHPFPIFFDKENATVEYVLTKLLLHLNYHLGQLNYLRRAME